MISNNLWKSNFKLLYYIASVIHRKYPPHVFVIYMYFVCLRIKKRLLYCHAIPCPGELIQQYLTANSDGLFDVNNCVLASEYMKKDLSKNSLNLAFLHLGESDDEYRIVHVISIPNLASNELIVSDCLFYNMSRTNYTNKIRLSSLKKRQIRIAKQVEVNLINIQHDVSNALIDCLLKNYFQTPRILYKYDVFSVNIKQYAPEFVCSTFQLSDVEELFFKCKTISSDGAEDSMSGHFCVVGETTMRQGQNVRGYIPAGIFKMCASDSLKSDTKFEERVISKCPYGLEEYMKNIEKSINPFVPKSKLSLKPAFLVQGNKGIGKNLLVSALASKAGLHIQKVECTDIQTSTPAQTESKIRNVFIKSKICSPCFLVLNNFENFGKDAEGNYDPRLISHFQTEMELLFEENHFPIILICLSNAKDISPELSRTFLETFTIEAPTQAQRSVMLRWLLRSKGISTEVSLDSVAAKTPGFVLGDLDALIYHAMKNCFLESEKIEDKICLRLEDIEKALDLMQLSYSASLGAPKVPRVLWSDVGGLQGLKLEIMRTINLPLQHPELLKMTGLKRSGILLFGPPGTGKTLVAKAVATECGLCFLSVKGPELLNMYVGQSEQNVRQVFERAREASPCIIFFDELDSLAPNRGISGDSGGVMDRVVSQLLAEMDGLNDNGTVFVIGATNRPDLLDPALLRPGRFDRLLYVGACNDTESKLGVLKALTRKFTLSPDVSLEKVAELCSGNVTGADLYSVCSNAWFSAVGRRIQDIETGLIEHDDLSPEIVSVTMSDFLSATKDFTSSLNHTDIQYFQQLNNVISDNK